jgi:hypothetical protein
LSSGVNCIDNFRKSLDSAQEYDKIWPVVKATVDYVLGKRRGSMMLFLDDLPLQVGAYHSVGTNNIVLNRRLVEIVEATLNKRHLVNALIYNLLLHEYLHALGELSEVEVRRQVVVVAAKSFGEDHDATILARKSPWILLKDIPLETGNTSKRVMQIVRNFEGTDKYIV